MKLVTTKGTQTPCFGKDEVQGVPPSVDVMAVDSNLTEDLVTSTSPQVAEPTENVPEVEIGVQTDSKAEENTYCCLFCSVFTILAVD